MNFAFTPEQEAVRDLARQILGDHVTHERLKVLENSGRWLHEEAWQELAKANLLGVAIPEEYGGSGLGLVELGLVLEEIGRAVAPVPALGSLGLAAPALVAFGTPDQKRAWLPGIAAGNKVLTAALSEPNSDDPLNPTTRAQRATGGWRLDGTKTTVPSGDIADRILVPARTPNGLAVFLLDPHSPGVGREQQILTHREPHTQLTLDGAVVAEADMLGDEQSGSKILSWIYEHAVAAYCAIQVGVCDRALRMTAEYTIGRQQFGVSIASFQAVHTRAADAYIDLEVMRLAAYELVYRLAHDIPATETAAIAKFWAADAGQHVAVASQHLHGGIGVDVDYPLHRYFLWAKHIELALGGAPQQLAKLGAMLAA